MAAKEHLSDQMHRQALAMASYALSRGKRVPAEALAIARAAPPADDAAFRRLVSAHEALAKLVSPARPATIEALHSPGSNTPRQPRVIGRLCKVLIGAVAGVVVLGGAHAALGFGAGYDPESDGISSLPHFAVANALFIALATLGASFQGLTTTQRRLEAMTFELEHVPAIWGRLWLGIVAGVLMATYLDLGSQSSTAVRLSRPLLALLGGFGSDVVYRLLDGLVKALSAALDRNVEDRLHAERTRSTLALERTTDEERRAATQNLLSIQQALVSGSLDEARALVDSMLPTSSIPANSETTPAGQPAEAAQ